jgi:DNA-binding transcriptional MerR regulator
MSKEVELIKMSELAKRSAVPAPTIKHYIREGLLPEPAKRTSRNMAYYDANLVQRIKTIKEIQRTRFLPLKVIKEMLDGAVHETSDATTMEGFALALAGLASHEALSRKNAMAEGTSKSELDWLEAEGLIHRVKVDGKAGYRGDDVALLKTLSSARSAGISEEMLPTTILKPYYAAIEELLRSELDLFRDGILPRADTSLLDLAQMATRFSESIVVLLRRKALIPTLSKVIQEGEKGAEKSKEKASRKSK